MIEWHATLRNLMLSAIAIGASGILLHAQLSSSLVTRGDDLSYRGDAARARIMYARAIVVDPNNVVAADRYIFASMISHRSDIVRRGIAVADRYLLAHPRDVSIRMDRGLSYQVLHRYREAADDFATVGFVAHDARALTFAGLDALHAGERGSSLRLIERALSLDPKFLPARRALARERS